MKKATMAIAACFMLAMIMVGSAHATALGLADGNYTITLDFLNNVLDTTATMSIGATGVTAFHANIPTVGAFDCNPCTPGVDSPDRVFSNGQATTTFGMFSGTFASCLPGNANCWSLTLFQFSNLISLSRTDTEPTPAVEHWSATPVPEPLSSTLLITGIAVLVLRSRIRRY